MQQRQNGDTGISVREPNLTGATQATDFVQGLREILFLSSHAGTKLWREPMRLIILSEPDSAGGSAWSGTSALGGGVNSPRGMLRYALVAAVQGTVGQLQGVGPCLCLAGSLAFVATSLWTGKHARRTWPNVTRDEPNHAAMRPFGSHFRAWISLSRTMSVQAMGRFWRRCWVPRRARTRTCGR